VYGNQTFNIFFVLKNAFEMRKTLKLMYAFTTARGDVIIRP